MGLIVAGSSLPARQDATDANCLARFLFAETSGTTFKNEISSTNDLSVTDGSVLVDRMGFFDRSVYFASGARNSAASAAGAWQPTSTITIDFWIYIISYLSGSYGRIVGKTAFPASWSAPYMCMSLEFTGASQLLGVIRTATSGQVSVLMRDQPQLQRWHHIASVYDGANLKLYLNGIFQSQVAATGNIDWQSSGKWFLGSVPSSFAGTSVETTGMYLEDLRINSSALSQTTIESRYRNGYRLTKP